MRDRRYSSSLPMISAPDGVIRTAVLRAQGVANSVIAARCRPGGAWRRLAPGVVLLADMPPTRRQLLRAAQQYAGPDALITGMDVLRARGSPLRVPAVVHVLIPERRRVASQRFVLIERTTRMPACWWDRGLAFSHPVRAVLDTARRDDDPLRVRTLFMGFARGRIHVLRDLAVELDSGSQRGSALPRLVLRELMAEANREWRKTTPPHAHLTHPLGVPSDKQQVSQTCRR